MNSHGLVINGIAAAMPPGFQIRYLRAYAAFRLFAPDDEGLDIFDEPKDPETAALLERVLQRRIEWWIG